MSESELTQVLYKKLNKLYAYLLDEEELVWWINGSNYGWYQCCLCGNTADETRSYTPTRRDLRHDPSCPVLEARYWRDFESLQLDPNRYYNE